jgi:putative DNA primase/helicase
MESANDSMMSAALAYAARGWRVHPLRDREKIPRTAHGCNDATTAATTINGWWSQWPSANVSIATGADSGIFVIDIDAECELPDCLRNLPPTTTALSSRGRHFYLRYPGDRTIGNRTRVDGLPIDVRGDGGYIVAPPSVHPSGAVYQWERPPNDYPLADATPEILDWIAPAKSRNGQTRKAPPVPDTIAEGQRDSTLASLAGSMRRRGLREPEILDALRAANRRCVPPLDEAELGRIAGSVSRYAPSANGKHEADEDIHLTDRGNAKRVVERFGDDLRYVFQWNAFLNFDGMRWGKDITGETVRSVKTTQSELFRSVTAELQALGEIGDETKRNALLNLLKHVLKWEDARAISRCIKLMESERPLPVKPGDFDTDIFLFNCRNCTIDLRSGTARGHRREDLITKLAPVDYDPQAKCPLWNDCLAKWMNENEDLITYLRKLIGYCLTGDVSEQALWFLYGAGANGKSTFMLVLLYLFGDYGIQAVSDLLLVKKGGTPYEKADLFGRRLAATIETEHGQQLAESLMKQMTGGDKIRARQPYERWFEFDATHKLFLVANHKPIVKGTDYAAWRRIKLIPWEATFTDDEKDPQLAEKLKAEVPGILNWAIQGCLDWQRDGLGEPDEVRIATAAYQDEQDTLGQFIRECCFVHRGARCKATALFDAYQNWSGDKVVTALHFREKMKAKGYVAKPGHANATFWHGIMLRGAADEHEQATGAVDNG